MMDTTPPVPGGPRDLDTAARYRAIVEDLPELVCRFLPDGCMTFANEAYCRFFGVRREELIGKPYRPLVHPDDLDFVNAQVAALNPEQPLAVIENRVRRADGELRWTEWTNRALFDSQGRLVELQAAGRDITERRLAEEATARLAAIVATADDAIYATGVDGTITSWNRAAERMFGYTAAEAIGHPIDLLLPGDDPHGHLDIGNRLARGETIDHIEVEKVTKSGQHIPVSLTLSPITDRSGRTIGISRIARDITERRRVEAERERAVQREAEARKGAEDASRLKDEFLAVVSHELRTPLNAILGWARMLREGAVPPDALPKALDTIERNARVQVQLIEDLLDVSNIVRGQLSLRLEPVSLGPVILEAVDAVRPAAARKEITLHVDVPAEDVVTLGDGGRLQQAVWNLLVNALKFTQKEGRVDVVLRSGESSATILVRDTGVGIPADALPYIWDRFRQADSRTIRAHGGLGLGLTIVAHVVQALGGTARVSSDGPGHGAAFEVTLPLHHAVAAIRPTPAHGQQSSLDGLRVLAVDDEPDARDMVRAILESCGAVVHTAASVPEAIAAARALVPDAVVADIGMPEQDGFDLIRLLRALDVTRHVPVIALTAYTTDASRDAALRAGFDAHLGKPVDPAALCARLAGLSRHRRHAER